MRRILFSLLTALALALTTAGLPVRALQDPRISCQELRDLGLPVVLSDRDLTGGEELGFCLVARPEEDTFIAYLPNTATPEDFRTAKLAYVTAMTAGGYDVCRIGVWRPLGREGAAPVPVTAADRLNTPHVCPARVVARDPGAASWLGEVEPLIADIAKRGAADLGVSAHRPLTVDLHTDRAAVAAALAAERPEWDPRAAADEARRGRSLTVLSPSRGMYMLVNLSDQPSQEVLARRLAHEYVHYLQSVAAGTLDAYPLWFLEGHAEYEMERLAGPGWNPRADAATRQRRGVAPSLIDLITAEQWASLEERHENGVYSRGYSAVAFIADRWGHAATARLLRSADESDPGRFDRTLSEITGMDLAGFDRALSEWLQRLTGSATFYNDSPMSQRLELADGRRFDLPACTTCTFHRAADTCQIEGRPSVRIELPPGDVRITRIVPNNRIHFPDSHVIIAMEPATNLTRCLELRV